jgi:hypothetical protein
MSEKRYGKPTVGGGMPTKRQGGKPPIGAFPEKNKPIAARAKSREELRILFLFYKRIAPFIFYT